MQVPKLRRYRVKLAGNDHSVIMQLDPDTAETRYPTAVEVAARATGGTRTKAPAPAKAPVAPTKGKAPAKNAAPPAAPPVGDPAPATKG